MRGKGCVDEVDPKPVHDLETYALYQKRIAQPLPPHARSGDRWTSEDEQKLLQFLDAGATQVQRAAAFPNRRWWRIRWKAIPFRGSDIKIPEVGKLKRNKTFLSYCQHTEENVDEQFTAPYTI
jgi:hypothetical protein